MSTDKYPTRRQLLCGAGTLGLTAMLGNAASPQNPAEAAPVTSAARAWEFLMEGNRRWAEDRPLHPHDDAALRQSLIWTQHPHAIVFTCVDSRVPPEYVFDAGNGDLMDVRTAAHTLDPLVTESVIYGPVELHTPLIVVLGHQHCGAVTLAWNALAGKEHADGFAQLTDRLTPAYQNSLGNDGDPIEAMIRANTALTVETLSQHPAIAKRLADGDMEIIGAHYSLETGTVERA